MDTHRMLIEAYVNGWKESNLDAILATLTDDCLIIESHGPTYRGKEQVRHWFADWLMQSGRVLSWDILSFYEVPQDSVVFFEWNFTCEVMGKSHHLPGNSLVKFLNNKITFMHEYRMTHSAYDFESPDII